MSKSEVPTTEEILTRLEIWKLHSEALLFRNDLGMDNAENKTTTAVINQVNQLIFWLNQNL